MIKKKKTIQHVLNFNLQNKKKKENNFNMHVTLTFKYMY